NRSSISASEPMRCSDTQRFVIRVLCLAPLAGFPLLTNLASLQPGVQRLLMRRCEGVFTSLERGTSFWTRTDMRFLKAAWLDRSPAAPDVLILGGSRAFPI